MLSITKDIFSFELEAELWSGALDTLDTVVKNKKFSELLQLLEELYPDPVDITTVNDLLWFEDDFIFEQLEIKLDEGQSLKLT